MTISVLLCVCRKGASPRGQKMEAQKAAANPVAMSLRLLIKRLLAHLTREVGRPIYSSMDSWPPVSNKVTPAWPLLVDEWSVQGANEDMFCNRKCDVTRVTLCNLSKRQIYVSWTRVPPLLLMSWPSIHRRKLCRPYSHHSIFCNFFIRSMYA